MVVLTGSTPVYCRFPGRNEARDPEFSTDRAHRPRWRNGMTETRKNHGLPMLILAAAALTAACSEPPGELAEGEPTASPPTESQLPSGHPPVTPPNQGGIAPPPAGAGTGAAALSWTTPAGWVAETPSSSMRRAQYRVEGNAGPAECVVFYFGPGQGGDARANAVRWADQFGQPDGGSSRDVMKTEEIEVAGLDVLLTEVTGIYSGGMAMMGGPSSTLADYALLGAIAQGPDANWFFKLTGPRQTVFAQRDAFRRMIESIRSGQAAQT